MDGKLDNAITQALESLRYVAQVLWEVGMGLFDLVAKGRHRSVSGVVGGMPAISAAVFSTEYVDNAIATVGAEFNGDPVEE